MSTPNYFPTQAWSLQTVLFLLDFCLERHKCECQPCPRISSVVMTLNQSNCLIPIQKYRGHYSLLKYSQMKAIYSWKGQGSLHKLLFKKTHSFDPISQSTKLKYFQDFAVAELPECQQQYGHVLSKQRAVYKTLFRGHWLVIHLSVFSNDE